MDKAIIISRCSTNDNKQDVTRQSNELISKYSTQYNIIKEFTYYKSGTKNDEVNREILEYATNNEIQHIITLEISRISRKISSFALFLEECNINKIDNFKLHTLLSSGDPNQMVQTMLSIASTFANMELSLVQERLNSGRKKYIDEGGQLGRKVGSIKSNSDILSQHSDVVKYLKQGHSVRNTATLTNKSPTTIQKIKSILKTV